MLANMKRSAHKNNGEIDSNPILTKIKLTPQMMTTRRANKICVKGINKDPLEKYMAIIQL